MCVFFCFYLVPKVNLLDVCAVSSQYKLNLSLHLLSVVLAAQSQHPSLQPAEIYNVSTVSCICPEQASCNVKE